MEVNKNPNKTVEDFKRQQTFLKKKIVLVPSYFKRLNGFSVSPVAW